MKIKKIYKTLIIISLLLVVIFSIFFKVDLWIYFWLFVDITILTFLYILFKHKEEEKKEEKPK